jgi:glycosyltransferase involved in cell wall biosynthesis
MKVVAISLDPNVLDSKSVASVRNALYGDIVDEYRVVVHYHKDTILELNQRVTVYGVGGRFKFVRLLRVGLLLRKLVKEGKCDVITSSDPYFFSFISYCVARIYHVGFEVHILGIEKLNAVRMALARFFVKRASAVRVNSTRLRDRVANEFNVPWKDIAFVPIHVPTEHLALTKEPLEEHQKEERKRMEVRFKSEFSNTFNFLFVGRLVEVKNIPMQLRAVAILKKEHPEVRVHVAGNGPDEDKLKALAASLGVSEHFIFHGRKVDASLGTLFRLCDSFMLTSYAEGWPMVIFETMTAQLPIIMTDVGCAGEMIKNEENGLVVPVNDADALAKAMKRMIEDEALRTRLIGAASQHIQNYWTRDQILSGYKQSWEKALAHKL